VLLDDIQVIQDQVWLGQVKLAKVRLGYGRGN
jgi:hypothetical protein